MRETFSEYKKTIESNLIGIKYLYDGDINYSYDNVYSEFKKSSSVSPSFIINCIISIYEKSFTNLKSKSTDVILTEQSLKYTSENWKSLDMNKLISVIKKELGCDASYIFTSKKSYNAFRFDKFYYQDNKPFPGYFYPLTKITGLNTSVLYSPFVEKNDDELILYAVDKSFQSLVYSIQNMEYISNIKGDDYLHEINYKFYDCRFKSLKIIIKNISKIREDKINELLSID